MTKVKSSNVEAIQKSGVNLIVLFKDGSEYIYFEAGHEFNAMLNSPSKGRFVHTALKKYRYAKR